ncbi:DUF2802 domain-containing protein [Aromatoleum diolicum]|uniref:DUF2802 domain-containing protein n=1 Tax=Aromatoleum diolicum TaxID=75796 RepID=A0ABX1Q7C8_9RHOO|nr:DUF2802 domain-containing protein [Aromatoleum diolicum]NMG74269.1 DUF2802 domain-containing protein [Aromatoleum diolicum]
MGLREVILLAIAVLAVYVGYQLYRVSRGGADKVPTTPATDVPDKASAPLSSTAVSAEDAEGDDDELFLFERPSPPHSETPPAGDAASRPESFQLELEVRQLRRDVAQQQTELADLRRLLDELGATVRLQKEQVDASLASHGASPEYNEALVFAKRGLDVEAIAERCGITVAEAALVQSLARSQAGESGSQHE